MRRPPLLRRNSAGAILVNYSLARTLPVAREPMLVTMKNSELIDKLVMIADGSFGARPRGY